MSYLKAAIIFFFFLGLGMIFPLPTNVMVGKISLWISAMLFISYIVMRLGMKYADKTHPALDTFALITGAFATILAPIVIVSI